MQVRVASLEQELKDKGEVVSRLEQIVAATDEQKVRMHWPCTRKAIWWWHLVVDIVSPSANPGRSLMGVVDVPNDRAICNDLV